MRALTLAIVFGLAAGPAAAQQKAAKAPPKGRSCTYDECVSVNKARGWDGASVSRWCTANPGKCDN